MMHDIPDLDVEAVTQLGHQAPVPQQEQPPQLPLQQPLPFLRLTAIKAITPATTAAKTRAIIIVEILSDNQSIKTPLIL